MSARGGGLTIRAAAPDDLDSILELLSASLGWSVDDEFRGYATWKHGLSSSRSSPAWVAHRGGVLVGYRAFLRWELESGDRPRIQAARAVDAATRPEAQGHGVFSALTAHALEGLRESGTELVFTTPNDKAGAGWVKAGARLVGQVPVAVRPRSLAGLARMLRARAPAGRWPVATDVGRPAGPSLADPAVVDLLASLPPPTAIRTRRTPEFLQWRYGFDPLGYRTLARQGDPRHGLAIFRLRRRGNAVEAALCDLLTPAGDREAADDLARAVARSSGADYVMAVRRGAIVDRAGAVALPRQGPRLYALSLSPGLDAGTLPRWDLALGDLELL